MLYTITVTCPHCLCPCPWAVTAEVEPPPDAIITIRCPSHGGPIRIPFRHFKPADSVPSGTPTDEYPPPPQEPEPRWWQFWKWSR